MNWYVFFAGGHGRSVADAIIANGGSVLGYYDDTIPRGQLVNGIPVLGGLSSAFYSNDGLSIKPYQSSIKYIVAIGDSKLRQHWHQLLEASGATLGTVFHPFASVSSSASIDSGCVGLAGAVINSNAKLERGVILNSGSVVDHDATCSMFSQLGVNAALAGSAFLGPHAYLAAGETLGCRQSRYST